MVDRSKIGLRETLSRIDGISGQLGAYAASKEDGAALVEAVKTACEIYLSLASPKQINAEIKALATAIRKRPMDVHIVLSDASPGARELIYRSPDAPSVSELQSPETRKDALQRLKAALTYAERRPGEITTIGPKLKKGRQENRPEYVLVSFLAAAFARATGKATGRSWSTEPKTDDDLSNFERLVKEVFTALKIDDQFNVKNLVRLHIEERKRQSDNKSSKG